MSGAEEEVIKHVLAHQHDYFRLLKVQRNASDSEIKSSYKRLALTCHPDKSRHPRAEEAFKAVAKAYDVLSDATKRRAYERGGEEGVLRQESGGGSGGGFQQHRGGGYHRQQAHPHDFFEEFLFGGARRQQQYYQQQQQGRQQGQHAHGEHVEVNLNFLFVIPILLAFIFISAIQGTLFDSQPTHHRSGSRSSGSSSYSTIPDFRLAEEIEFSSARTVGAFRDLNIKYFVSPKTNSLIERRQYDIRALEQEVLRQHRDSLGRRCESATMRQKARKQYGSPAVCEEYQRLSSRLSG